MTTRVLYGADPCMAATIAGEGPSERQSPQHNEGITPAQHNDRALEAAGVGDMAMTVDSGVLGDYLSEHIGLSSTAEDNLPSVPANTTTDPMIIAVPGVNDTALPVTPATSETPTEPRTCPHGMSITVEAPGRQAGTTLQSMTLGETVKARYIMHDGQPVNIQVAYDAPLGTQQAYHQRWNYTMGLIPSILTCAVFKSPRKCK